MSCQKANLKERTTFWSRILLSASGENRLDILHPSLKSRIQKIEKILTAKGVVLDTEAETQKQSTLNSFTEDAISNIKKNLLGQTT